MTGQMDIGIQISLVCNIYHVHSCRIFADCRQIDPKAGKVYIHQKSKKQNSSINGGELLGIKSKIFCHPLNSYKAY